MLNETNFTILAFSKTGTAHSPGMLACGFIPGFSPGFSLIRFSAMLSLQALFSFARLASASASFPIDCTIDSARINCPQAFHSHGIQPLSPYPKGLM
jgi:hypothetical protein